ncbi:hypothetical protein SAMN04487989_102348 [Bizionia echini]|uniref:MORN repeat variant n=1 Tax=Bizionia echini TaxID=649333 RepID=A0A1I5AXH3_9FLAO|nr:hypothetical protein [Bizionia echini]MBP93931.1 hypothetical protein [Flavobacteriaceae bacterium]SFN67155.1 hypothetical protein SAMN04487989_102348 [Bizionia echini]|tara:strand:+ start:684 stop:1232 length:549 start_codon:yes stop_codon:yes gene_type:complete
MKTLIYVGLFLISGTLFAQEKARDMSQETETKTITTDNGREVTQKKVKVTTTEKSEVKLSKADANKINQERIVEGADKKVTQTIEIDNDMDPFYDSKIEHINYQKDGKNYKFVKTTNGFDVSFMKSGDEYGRAIKNLESRKYEFKTADFSGVGYFDNEGNFVLDYYDKETGTYVTKKFVSLK